MLLRVVPALLALFFFTGVHSASAQFSGGTEPLTISISPESPRPYDEITITPRSTLLNLPASTITISVNGVVIEEGSGGRSVSYKLGGAGKETVITITAVSDGETYVKEKRFIPADVALVVEPVTDTPPFYTGAALVAPEGRVRIIAMADLRSKTGQRVSPENLSYTWKLGERTLTEHSGIGRSVLLANAAPRYRDARISVIVSTTDNAIRGTANTTISAQSPELLIYRDDPLLGPDFAHALSGTWLMKSEEETFRAGTFHFASEPIISWKLNGSAAQGGSILTVRAPEEGRGTARIEASATHLEESAESALTLDFGTASRGLFGI